MDGCGITLTDDPVKFPLAYGITHKGELRRFVNRMTEIHQAKGIIKVLELVDDQNYGLPQEAWTVITLHKSASLGREIFFNLNYMEDIPGILNGTGKYANGLTALELRHVYQHWYKFRENITFWKNDSKVNPPWEE